MEVSTEGEGEWGHSRKPGSGRQRKVNERGAKIVDNALEEDDERTGAEISKILQQNGYTISVLPFCGVGGGWGGHAGGVHTVS